MAARGTVAAHLDISTSRLKGLVDLKVIDDAEPGEMDMDTARVNYIRHLRSQASGRGGDSLSRERARLAGEQADRAARENKLASAQVIERQDVLTVMTAAFSACRSRLLGIPTKGGGYQTPLAPSVRRARRLIGLQVINRDCPSDERPIHETPSRCVELVHAAC